MDRDQLIKLLERFADVLPAVVRDLNDEDMRWKPSDADWSILEVLCHLADEEVSDFRQRIDCVLRDPVEKWPPIDPPAWAIERKYNEQSPRDVLHRFLNDRSQSIARLRSLNDADWSIASTQGKLGSLRAGDLLASWVAHDWLHLRQISKRLYQLTQRNAGEYSADYAGRW